MLRMNFISLPLQILQMVAGEAILSCPNAIKPLVSAPYPAGGSGCGSGPWCLSPPVGECCPLVGVPPSATTGAVTELYRFLSGCLTWSHRVDTEWLIPYVNCNKVKRCITKYLNWHTSFFKISDKTDKAKSFSALLFSLVLCSYLNCE